MADRGDGIADAHRSQAAAARECLFADRGDGIWYLHRSQAAAAKEGIAADRGDGIADAHRSQAAAASVSTNYWISISCWLKGRKVGEVGCGGGEGCGFNVFNFYKLQKHVRFFGHTFIHKTKFTLIDDVK